ncbi:hypothetical protein AAEX28_01150 [Lentisphaerota bacterium WC36G]|nr:hypothetical protein LJT99_04030 [Lentisphaerae bacterium WC36]
MKSFKEVNDKGWKRFKFIIFTVVIIGIFGAIFSYSTTHKILIALKRVSGFITIISTSGNGNDIPLSKNILERIFNLNKPLYNVTDKEKQFICTGDLSQKNEELRYKAVHDMYPNNKIYLANYISHVKKPEIARDVKFNKLTEHEKKLVAEKNVNYRKLLDYAERIEPENALYNYLRCNSYISEAVTISSLKKNKTKREKKLQIIKIKLNCSIKLLTKKS